MEIVNCRTIYIANASSYFRGECDYDISIEGSTREEAEEKLVDELLRINILPDGNPNMVVSAYRVLDVEDEPGDCTEFKSEPAFIGKSSAKQHPKVAQFLQKKAQKQDEENKHYQALRKAERLRVYEEVKKELESRKD